MQSTTVTYARANNLSNVIVDYFSPRLYFANLPFPFAETCLGIEIPPTTQVKRLKYSAVSLSTGKEICVTTNINSAILHGIDPGDKYEVLVHETTADGFELIAKSEFQSSKYIAIV